MVLTYAYLLRVPIAAGLVLAAFAPVALWKGSDLTTLLERCWRALVMPACCA
jgi:hypothetical protein